MSSARASVRAENTDAALTCDGFLDGRIQAHQPRKGPRAAIDALFLAAAIPAKATGTRRVLEAGTGSGVASLALAARVPGIRITGVELQPALSVLARKNVALNAMQDRIEIVEADVTAPARTLLAADTEPETFDHVAANPPFHDTGRSRLSPDAAIATAHAAGRDALGKWIGFLARMAAPRATVTLLHKASALEVLLGHLAARFGGLTVFPLFPREGEPANRIIVQGIKGSRAPLVLARGLVLHEADGSFTPGAEAVLRAGAGLAVGTPGK